MKVLFLSSMYEKPGSAYAGQAVHRQAVELQRLGIEVRVVCPVPRFTGSVAGVLRGALGRGQIFKLGTTDVDGVKVTYLPYPNVPFRLWVDGHVRILRRYVDTSVNRLRTDFPFDLVHAHRLFPTGYVAGPIARRWEVPFVLSAVGSDVHTHPDGNRAIHTRTTSALRTSDAVTAVSRRLAEEIYALEPSVEAVSVVRRGVDSDLFSPAAGSKAELRASLGLPGTGIGICSVCHLVREKGVLELVEAFEQLAARNGQCWLLLVGDGPLEEEIRMRVRSNGLGSRVFLVGFRPHEEVPAWLNAADVFVLASYDEGLPNVVLEAMACARPVVATDVGGVAEAVRDGVTGLLVPPRASDELHRALKYLVRSRTYLEEMGIAGRQSVCADFTWERSTTDLLNVYREVLRNPSIGSDDA